MRSNILLRVALGLTVVGAPIASATDYWDLSSNNDNGITTRTNLLHGASQQHDLEANPGPVKSGMAAMGLLEEVYRLPMVPPKPESKAKIEVVLKELGLLKGALV